MDQIEWFAQRSARYYNISAEDSEYLNVAPDRFKTLYEESKHNPRITYNWTMATLVPTGRDPESYLHVLDEQIAKLTPPKSYEDRFMRLVTIQNASMIHEQLVVSPIVLKNRRLEVAYNKCKLELWNQYLSGEMVFIKQKLAAAWWAASEALYYSTPQTCGSQGIGLLPEPSGTDDIAKFLNDPVFGQRYMCTSSDGSMSVNAHKGVWTVNALTVWKTQQGINHEHDILFETIGDCPVTLGTAEVRYLLEHSEVVE